MSAKDLFDKKIADSKVFSSVSRDQIGSSIESAEFVEKSLEEKNLSVPNIDYSNPKNFAVYGSAEQYYQDSINYIKDSYPYDGSLKEKLEWEISSSYLDRYIFENEYPRTNGSITLGQPYGAFQEDAVGYQRFGEFNHVYLRGGPHTASGGMLGKELYETFSKSNQFSTSSRRGNNLELDPINGATVEFWFKKDSFISGSEANVQTIFDVWNSSSVSSKNGRLVVEIRPGIAGQERKFYVEFRSGSAGLGVGGGTAIGQGLEITGSFWKHYAITFANSGSEMQAKLYVTGVLNDTITAGTSTNVVTGSMIANIGAMITRQGFGEGAYGWNKLSASLDEFRFWKIRRNAEQIGKYWFTQVGAGANTDESNVNLGVYYKFNEGIVNENSIHLSDTVVLDYSGRVSNGKFIGYSVGQRHTGSAMVLASAARSEFKDPILYSEHSGVVDVTTRLTEQGYAFDMQNNSSIYNSIPEWITKEDRKDDKNVLLKMTQTMASYLDTLHMQISAFPKIKNIQYVTGTAKPYPFVSRFVEGAGLVASDLFSEADAQEMLASRDDFREFSEKLYNIKNKIYQNIYNNLNFVFKSKGTEKSFRNIIRCFGIDDELIKLNLYADNVNYKLEDNVRYVATRKNVIDFNDPDRFGATVYQHTSSVTSSQSFITAPSGGIFHGATYECDVVFPRKFEKDSDLYYSTPYTMFSLFGAHTSEFVEIVGADKTWKNPDHGNFQVYATKEEVDSRNVSFSLSGTANVILPHLTTSVFKDVYDNQKWSFSVRIRPETYPLGSSASGTLPNNFIVEFYGYNKIQDIINNRFVVSASISNSAGITFMTRPKRFFVGSHRTNFTGSALNYCDAKIASLRVWGTYLTNEELEAHANDPMNYGVLNPGRNVYMSNTSASFGLGN